MIEFSSYDVVRAVLLVAAFGLLQGASGCPPPPGPTPSTATCAEICAHWEKLGCEESKPTPAGESCASVCQNIVDTGIFEWDLECRAAVKACDEIDRCEAAN